jgi:acetoin utilization deacetylase AcuC-like enzyme
MYAFSSDHYVIDLPANHRFPIQKYRRIRERLLAEGTLRADELLEPTLADPRDICRVHTKDYWEQLSRGTLPAAAIRRLGLPWSESLVRRSRASVQGTLSAARIAIREAVAVNLAGGTHHAFPDRGEGYCALNDIAVAIRTLQHDAWVQRMAIVDCDVHQGNGTAAIFANEPDVFTFSIHGDHNYPFRKVPGTLDIALPDGTGDDDYLGALKPAVSRLLAEFRPGLVFYLAGADPHEGDRLGRLRLTHRGLRRRDELVLRACRDAAVPVAITLGGGYGRDLDDTVEAHCNTIRAARALFRTAPARGSAARKTPSRS